MNLVTRTSQTDVVVEQIKQFLISDIIQLNDKLPTEKEFCERLGVGRSTVREAIRALQVMGYVKILPGRGAFLAAKNLDNATPSIVSWLATNKVQIEDVVEVRMGLETLASRLATLHAGEAELQALDRVRVRFENALANAEHEKLSKLDEEFHQTMVEASKNELLIALNKMVSQAFGEFRRNSFRIKEHAANAVIPHRDIMAALRARDADLVQVFVRRHLERVLIDQENVIKRRQGITASPHKSGPIPTPSFSGAVSVDFV